MRSAMLALLIYVSLTPTLASAGWLGDVEIYDRTSGRILPVHEHGGRLYVVGEPKHRYELRVRNRSNSRVLAVTSVDGVNVITGETADQQQSGYVLEGWDSVRVEGWRKSLDEVARFYFTRLPDSYAARTGRPNDVGVIGVALFHERERCCEPRRHSRLYENEAARESAPSAPSADAASGAVQNSRKAERAESRLGTGHGERESSPAQYVHFERASTTPDETIVIYYDSRANLIAQGVLPGGPRYARQPNPFPNGFVPDP